MTRSEIKNATDAELVFNCLYEYRLASVNFYYIAAELLRRGLLTQERIEDLETQFFVQPTKYTKSEELTMGFRSGAYATIWDVKPGQKYTKVRLAVTRRNKQTGEYEQEFGGFCNFVGHAHTKAGSLKVRDRIKLGDVDVTTRFDKANNKEYTNYTVFDFEPFENNRQPASNNSAPPQSNETTDNSTDGLPF